jgi:hypothetical protein
MSPLRIDAPMVCQGVSMVSYIADAELAEGVGSSVR